MVDLNINLRVKDMPTSNSSLVDKNEKSNKSTVFIADTSSKSKEQNKEDVHHKESVVTIESPFAKHSSPEKVQKPSPTGSTKDQKSETDSKDSIDSDDNKSTKTNSSIEWRIKRYLPKGFRKTTSSEPKGRSICRLIRFDCKVLNSCTAYSQIIILVTSLVIVFIILLSGCFDSEDHRSVWVQDLENTSLPSEAETEKPISSFIKCNIQYYFVIICLIAANVQLLTLLCYMFHVVEALPNLPWLLIEIIFYPLWCLQYFVISIWISFYSLWLLLAAILGLIDSIVFFILASIKYRKYKSGRPAQDTSDDPDGNTFRRISPNLKFTKASLDQNDENYFIIRASHSLDL